jgi:hypothetical protein
MYVLIIVHFKGLGFRLVLYKKVYMSQLECGYMGRIFSSDNLLVLKSLSVWISGYSINYEKLSWKKDVNKG